MYIQASNRAYLGSEDFAWTRSRKATMSQHTLYTVSYNQGFVIAKFLTAKPARLIQAKNDAKKMAMTIPHLRKHVSRKVRRTSRYYASATCDCHYVFIIMATVK